MRVVVIWLVVGLVATAGCGSKSPPPLRYVSSESLTKLHDLLGHPTSIGEVTSTDEAQLQAVDLEKMKEVLSQPNGLVAALDLLAAKTPDVEISMWQKAGHRVMLPEIEAILGKSSGVESGSNRGGPVNWQQFGWIEIGFVFGAESKNDITQNAGLLRLSVRGYKDSQKLEPEK